MSSNSLSDSLSESLSESLSDSISASLSSSSSVEAAATCGATDRRVELVPYFQKNYVAGLTHGYRIRIVAQNPCNMEAEIFRYYRYPTDLSSGSDQDECTGVCSWVDMEELPVDEPRTTDCPQAFRQTFIDVVVDTETIATDLWERVKEEVDQLVATMNSGDVLEAGASYWPGGEP